MKAIGDSPQTPGSVVPPALSQFLYETSYCDHNDLRPPHDLHGTKSLGLRKLDMEWVSLESLVVL